MEAVGMPLLSAPPLTDTSDVNSFPLPQQSIKTSTKTIKRKVSNQSVLTKAPANGKKAKKADPSLFIPEDIRRIIPQMFENIFNGLVKDQVAETFKQICADNFVIVTRSMDNPFGPNYREVQGHASCVAFADIIIEAVPDIVFTVVDSKFYKKPKNESVIVSSYTTHGHMLYAFDTTDVEDPDDIDGAVDGLQLLFKGSTGKNDNERIATSPEHSSIFPPSTNTITGKDGQPLLQLLDIKAKPAVTAFPTLSTLNIPHAALLEASMASNAYSSTTHVNAPLAPPNSTPDSRPEPDVGDRILRRKRVVQEAYESGSVLRDGMFEKTMIVAHNAKFTLAHKVPPEKMLYKCKGTMTIILDDQKKVKRLELFSDFDTSAHKRLAPLAVPHT